MLAIKSVLLAPFRPDAAQALILRAGSASVKGAWLLAQLAFIVIVIAAALWIARAMEARSGNQFELSSGIHPGAAGLLIAVPIIIGLHVASILLAFAQLPLCHPGGPLRRTFVDCLRTTVPAWSWVLIAAISIAGTAVYQSHAPFALGIVGMPSGPSSFILYDVTELFITVAPGLFAIPAIWLCGRGAAVLRFRNGSIDSPPTCSNCGYNLSGHAPGALCPECGHDSGLKPRRLLAPWRISEFPARFVRALLAPRTLEIPDNTPDEYRRSARLAALCYAVVALGTFSLTLVFQLLNWSSIRVGGLNKDLIVLSFVFSLTVSVAVALGAWAVHRLIAAALFAWWAWRKRPVRSDAFAFVIFYEAALAPVIFLPLVAVHQALGAVDILESLDGLRSALASQDDGVWLLSILAVVILPWLIRFSLAHARIREAPAAAA